MLKGIFIEEKEILIIVQNLTRQQEVIDEMFKQARDNPDVDKIYSQSCFAQLLNQEVLDLLSK